MSSSHPKPPDPSDGRRRERSHLRLVGHAQPEGRAQSSPELELGLDSEADDLAARLAKGALPDGELVTLACQGDRGAFEHLYRRHVRFAIHLATRIQGSDRDVEDIVHDSFLKAFERLRDLVDRSAFRGWLGSIVVRAVRSRLRRHKLMKILGLAPPADHVDLDVLASHDASPHTRAQLAQIYALLRTLPTDERIAWTLRSVERHDLEAVAKLTSCSLATAKRRIKRAQDFLEQHFVAPRTRPDGEPSEPSGEAQASELAGAVSDARVKP